MTIDCYNQQASDWCARFLGLNTQKLCDKFMSFLPEKAHILDIGCGPGRDTKYFLDHGYQVTAFDGAEDWLNLPESTPGILFSI